MFAWIKGDLSDTNKTLARSDERLANLETWARMVEERLSSIGVMLVRMELDVDSLYRSLEAVRDDTYWLRYHPSRLQRLWAWLCRPCRRML